MTDRSGLPLLHVVSQSLLPCLEYTFDGGPQSLSLVRDLKRHLHFDFSACWLRTAKPKKEKKTKNKPNIFEEAAKVCLSSAINALHLKRK